MSTVAAEGGDDRMNLRDALADVIHDAIEDGTRLRGRIPHHEWMDSEDAANRVIGLLERRGFFD